MTEVAVVGSTHRRTPIQTRERLHRTPETAATIARAMAGGTREAVVLATCNRTELYFTAQDTDDAQRQATEAAAQLGGEAVTFHANIDAARHLFRVAAGLESIVLGDTHVAAQVRQAHRAARRVGATRPLIDRLFEAASAASKRVRTETNVSSGATSIPAAALSAVGPLANRRVLIVGAGKMARLAATLAASRGCGEIVVANRSLEGARDLADQVGGRVIPVAGLAEEVAAADVVIAATAASSFVLTAEHAAAAQARRYGRPLLVIDLGLPRDVDPAFHTLEAARVLDLDDLRTIVAANGSRRHEDVEQADAITCEEAERYEVWRQARSVVPAITALYRQGEEARGSVLTRHTAALGRLAPADRALVETITAQLVARLLHAPTLALRSRETRGLAAYPRTNPRLPLVRSNGLSATLKKTPQTKGQP